ncbi:MAG: DUF4476 domain-containing protein [Gemmatimonadaceae bacterium]|nr:DUF4476 domain-containing protein [Chitinophagaceae bacterium]
MKIWIALFVLLSGTLSAAGQQDFFLYLQTDNRQPFYVKLNQQIYSSTESGYAIIPKLGDSTYTLTVGFPKNQFPEQLFSISMNRKDAGYLIKNFGDRGWGLFNLQSMAVIMNSNPPEKKSPEITGIRKTDNFSLLLANVVNDTAVLYASVKPKPAEPVVKKEPVPVPEPVSKQPEPQKDTAITVTKVTEEVLMKEKTKVNADTVSQTKEAQTKEAVAVKVAQPERTLSTQKINKAAELLTDTSYIAIYVDESTAPGDTIRVSIPFAGTRAAIFDTTTRKTRELEVVRIDTGDREPLYRTDPPKQDTTATIKTEPLYRNDKPDADSASGAKESLFRIDSAKTIRSDSAAAKPVAAKVNCLSVATENEIDKLRIKMMAETGNDKKIEAAKKVLKEHCVTTKHVRSLSELFNSNEGRLKWFETTLSHTSDPASFSSLEWLLTDESSRVRFRNLLLK